MLCQSPSITRIPRLYAAASLKHLAIEAAVEAGDRIPRLYAAASLKQHGPGEVRVAHVVVFRGFMPRPH